MNTSHRGRAAVVVLGDFGRSPRMQYHALSLANQAGLEVDIVAYGGSDPHLALLEHKSIHVHKMTQWSSVPQSLPKLLRPFMLVLKAISQFCLLLWNPPSVPTLVAVKWASWLKHSAFIVDWHNFGYTLLALSVGRTSIFVAVYRWVEKHYGSLANGSFCVTKAMQRELDDNWGIKATVLYDQPHEFFRPASLEEKHTIAGQPSKSHDMGKVICDSTLFTSDIGGDIIMNQNRPAVIISSTSWTLDEDFNMLLEAALMYDTSVAGLLNETDSSEEEVLWNGIYNGKQCSYPNLLFIITGKGPEKEKYEHKIGKLKLKRVAFRTMWLSAEFYSLLLGSADLGVCLHTSSSGLDLPMKVVDMFGCGLPVCAVSYSCIQELLMVLFKGFPDECEALSSLRNGVLAKASSSKWAPGWAESAMPLISEVSGLELTQMSETPMAVGEMPEVPRDGVHEIGQILPDKSNFRFKILTNFWTEIPSSHEVVKSDRIKPERIISMCKFFQNPSLHVIGLDTESDGGRAVDSQLLEGIGYRSRLECCCDGLALLRIEGDVLIGFVIINPVTERCMHVPIHPDLGDFMISGLGYSSIDDDYKLVVLTPPKYQVHIFSLKTRSRKINAARSPYVHGRAPVYVDGNLYFMVSTYNRGYHEPVIVAFDMDTESFAQLQVPPLIPCGPHVSFSGLQLAVMGGRVAIMFSSSTNTEETVDVSVREEMKYWRNFTITLKPGTHASQYRLISRLGEFDFLLVINSKDLAKYNCQTRVWRNLDIYGLTESYNCKGGILTFRESLVCPLCYPLGVPCGCSSLARPKQPSNYTTLIAIACCIMALYLAFSIGTGPGFN
ncbi:hypothetical protein OROMI_021920 [Orobanche minor]